MRARVLGIKVQKRKATEIVESAARWRRRFAPSTKIDERVDMLEVLEAFDGTMIPLSNGMGPAEVKLAVENNLPKHVLGITSYDRATNRIFVGIAAPTYDDMDYHGYARFTAAHEIAHVHWHLDEIVKLTTLPHDQVALARANPKHDWWEDSEYQANTFAAAFLAPDDGLKLLMRDGKLQPETVMTLYGMGRTAAECRIRNYLRGVQLAERSTRRRVRHLGGR